jgi:hypothetical protein
MNADSDLGPREKTLVLVDDLRPELEPANGRAHVNDLARDSDAIPDERGRDEVDIEPVEQGEPPGEMDADEA